MDFEDIPESHERHGFPGKLNKYFLGKIEDKINDYIDDNLVNNTEDISGIKNDFYYYLEKNNNDLFQNEYAIVSMNPRLYKLNKDLMEIQEILFDNVPNKIEFFTTRKDQLILVFEDQDQNPISKMITDINLYSEYAAFDILRLLKFYRSGIIFKRDSGPAKRLLSSIHYYDYDRLHNRNYKFFYDFISRLP